VDDWDAFVRAVVSRYKGKIASYEIWNEPNDRRYWTGSLRELVDMAQRAYRIIKAIDPAARVISPSPTYTKEGPPAQWLDQYLSAGGGESADVIGFHGYVSAKPETVRFVIQGIKTALARHGVKKELWDTEAGWGRNTVLPNEDERAAFVIKSFLIQWSEGVNRFYWYQWDNADWGTLWSGVSGTNKAGRALARARAWMVGAVLNGPCRESDGVWRCSLTRSGKRQEILWSSSAEKILPVDNGQKSVESLVGEVAAVKASSLRVSPSPILLRSHE
jgi:polysaccharide biosynthesis protein PslG